MLLVLDAETECTRGDGNRLVGGCAAVPACLGRPTAPMASHGMHVSTKTFTQFASLKRRTQYRPRSSCPVGRKSERSSWGLPVSIPTADKSH